MYNTKTCWSIPIRWYLCRFALPSSTIYNAHHSNSLLWTVHSFKKLHPGPYLHACSITCQCKFEELCNHLKPPEMENIQEAPTLPFRTWAFLSPAPPERCKGKPVLPVASVSASQPVPIIDFSTYPSCLATMPANRTEDESGILTHVVPLSGYWGMVFLSSSQCFVSLCLSIGSYLV